jgi:AcrR family transcriptional regulator
MSRTETSRKLPLIPKLWEDTIETHRRSVRDAALDAAGTLVGEMGLRGVTMSAIAERTGIGRATLYRYFSDADAILAAWHERHVTGHVERLGRLAEGEGAAVERLEALLIAYARAEREQPRDEIAATLHGGPHMGAARHRLSALLAGLISEAAADGAIRTDVTAAELAEYCLHALGAAGESRSRAAVLRLVTVTMTGLHAPQKPSASDARRGRVDRTGEGNSAR